MRDKATREQFDPALKANAQIVAKCQAHGLLLRPLPGDSIGICPPMIITEPEIDQLFDRLQAGLDDSLGAMPHGGLSAMAAEPHPWLMPLHRRVATLGLAVAWLGLRGAGSSPAACGSGWPSASSPTASGTSSCRGAIQMAVIRRMPQDARLCMYGDG